MQEEFDFPIFLNADHTHSLEKALEAAKSWFDAVVYDLSALAFEQNVRQTRAAVEALKGIDPEILVEGEIGDIGTGSEIHTEAPSRAKNLTTPEEAKQYVESTKIDILAPAVGNMHGMLVSMVQGEAKKRLDIGRIAQIKAAAQTARWIGDRRSRFAEGNRCRDYHHSLKHGTADIVEARVGGRLEKRSRRDRPLQDFAICGGISEGSNKLAFKLIQQEAPSCVKRKVAPRDGWLRPNHGAEVGRSS